MPNNLSDFLKEASNYDISLNESVFSVKGNEKIKDKLNLHRKSGDDSIYKLQGIDIVLFDSVPFKEAYFVFENNLLKVVLFESYNNDHEKFYDKLCNKYGKSKDYLNELAGPYFIWNNGKNELALMKKGKYYFVRFYEKTN